MTVIARPHRSHPSPARPLDRRSASPLATALRLAADDALWRPAPGLRPRAPLLPPAARRRAPRGLAAQLAARSGHRLARPRRQRRRLRRRAGLARRAHRAARCRARPAPGAPPRGRRRVRPPVRAPGDERGSRPRRLPPRLRAPADDPARLRGRRRHPAPAAHPGRGGGLVTSPRRPAALGCPSTTAPALAERGPPRGGGGGRGRRHPAGRAAGRARRAARRPRGRAQRARVALRPHERGGACASPTTTCR